MAPSRKLNWSISHFQRIKGPFHGRCRAKALRPAGRASSFLPDTDIAVRFENRRHVRVQKKLAIADAGKGQGKADHAVAIECPQHLPAGLRGNHEQRPRGTISISALPHTARSISRQSRKLGEAAAGAAYRLHDRMTSLRPRLPWVLGFFHVIWLSFLSYFGHGFIVASFCAHPQGFQFVGGETLELLPFGGGYPLHFTETPGEFAIGLLERDLRIETKKARQVYPDEQQVADFVLDSTAVVRGQRFTHFGGLFTELLKQTIHLLAIETDVSGTAGELMGFEQSAGSVRGTASSIDAGAGCLAFGAEPAVL